MRRRNFLKNITKASLAPLLLNGIPVQQLMGQSALKELAAQSTNDRVLVLIQLHGGNDGLNTLVPLNQYDIYHRLRSNIALPQKGSRSVISLDNTLPESQMIGLHPDIRALKELYEQGKTAIVQGVGYDNMNGSHFRSRDIWFMGGNYDQTFNSGWTGRYLSELYPDYPDKYPSMAMPDPLALELGSRVSLAFHREDGIPTAVALEDPDQFYRLSEGGGAPAEVSPNGSYYDEELSYIAGIEDKGDDYAQRLYKVFSKGKNVVAYPDKYSLNAPYYKAKNHLSSQLKTIARLMSGGCQTRVYLARLGGFDTHALQVEQSDSSMGEHAALLHNLFEAIKAFQNDLKALELEDKVMTVTFSEFGRRATSNGSLGTDHGTTAPMFVFGKHVNAGVIGENPDLSNLTPDNNLRKQHDYRQVFGTLLADWMGATNSAIEAARLERFTRRDQILPIINKIPSGSSPSPAPEPSPAPAPEPEKELPHQVNKLFPNPAYDEITLEYYMASRVPHRIVILNANGVEMDVINRKGWDYGFKKAAFRLDQYKSGNYMCVLEIGSDRIVKHFIKK
ncbi:MAG: DUF1501 domain-containing protein [Cyclobacteriaceae bacterium]